MIKVKLWPETEYDEALYCPAFFCGVCGEQIVDLKQGVYTWGVDKDWKPTGEVQVMHRDCMPADPPIWEALNKLLDRLEYSASPVSQWGAIRVLQVGKAEVKE